LRSWTFIALIGAAALIVILGVMFLLWRRRRAKQKQRLTPPPPPKNPVRAQRAAQLQQRLSELFAAELRALDQNVGGLAGRYAMPWCIVMGEPGVGQSTLLASTGMHVPFHGAPDEVAAAAGCRFWFYEKGVAIDVSSEVWQDEDVFAHLAALLRAARPKRPLDSALLVAPATHFIGDDKLGEEQLKGRAELLYQRLQQLQQFIGLRLPTYVLLSKADALPGFVAFAGGLSGAQREQVLGWSSAHEPDAPYDSAWIDAAFAEIYKTQTGLQVDLLASAKLSDKERDAAFLLPRNTQALREPLRVYIDQLFRSNVYSESNLLRGFYLCGDATIASAMVQAPDAGKQARQPIFLLHLFQKKILPESGLTRPLRKGLITGAQALRTVKITLAVSVLLSILLLWTAYANLSRDAHSVISFFDKVPTGSSSSVAQDKDRFAQRTQELLAAVSNVSTSRLVSVRLPTSWFSSLDDDVQEVMRRSFETVVLAGLHQGLELKAKQVLALDSDPVSRPAGADSDEPAPAGELRPGDKKPAERMSSKLVQVQALRAMPEFQELREFSRAYTEFTQQVEIYNRLGSDHHKRFDTVAPLVKYVFGVDLERGFDKNSDFYAEALANATYRPFDLRTLSAKVQSRARSICRALQRRLFVENPIQLESEEIRQYVDRLKTESESGAADLPTLMELRETMQRLDRDLARVELLWMAKESLDLGDAFADVLDSLGRFAPSGELADEVKMEWQSSHQQLRRQLLGQELPGLGAMLIRDADKNRIAMTSATQNVKAGVESFLALSFVQQQIEKPRQQTPEGQYKVNWNEDLLRQALAQAEAYESYVRDRVGGVYQQIREVVKHSAIERLGQNMPALVGQARRLERVLRFAGDVNALQDEITGEVAELKRVSSTLRQILETYDRLSLKAAHGELYHQLEEDNRELLRRIDLLMEREEMYRISSKLSEWRGEKAPVLAAFDVEDADALAQYIKAQRNRIKGWAHDYAKVPVSLLDGLTAAGNSSDPLVSKWRNIVNQLEYFEKLTPGNSVKDMESFMDTTLITVTPDNCLDKLPRRTSENSDYFLQTRARIQDAVRKRCLIFASEKILELYDHLARRFNRELAGKFPFTRSAQSLDDPDASPRDIRGFFQEFDEFIQRYDAYSQRRDTQSVVGDIGREINGFLESMRHLRPFFAQLLVDRSSEVARYNLAVEYRVNKGNEINGQQVAEWGFTAGEQRLEDGQGVWQIGDRIRLSMRWAKDGLYIPAQTGQARNAVVDTNDSISFEFAGIWSLVRLIRGFRATPTDLRKSLDRQPHVLKFVVDITERKRSGRLHLLPDSYYTGKGNAPTGAAKLSFLYNKAVLYVRVGLTAQDSKEPLTLPVEWPSFAPGTRGGAPQ
jgi:type VI secretion system protein ImpL